MQLKTSQGNILITKAGSVGFLFDVDGPLVHKDSSIPEEIKIFMKNLLLAKETAWIKLITGRPTSFALRLYPHTDSVLLTKGEIWGEKGLTRCTATGKKLPGLSCPVDMTAVKQKILPIFNRLVKTYTITTIIYDSDKYMVQSFYWKPGLKHTPEIEKRFEHEIQIISQNMQNILSEKKEIRIMRTPIALDIEPIGYGKYQTAAEIIRTTTIPEYIVVFGDSPEDDWQIAQAIIDSKVKTTLVYYHVGENPLTIPEGEKENCIITQTKQQFGVINTYATALCVTPR